MEWVIVSGASNKKVFIWYFLFSYNNKTVIVADVDGIHGNHLASLASRITIANKYRAHL